MKSDTEKLFENAGIEIYPVQSTSPANRHRFLASSDWIRVLALIVASAAVLVTLLPANLIGIAAIAALVLLISSVTGIVKKSVPQAAGYLQYFLLLVIFVPTDLPVFIIAQACIFGLVFGELVFGGRGYSFVHPAACALVYLFLTNPGLDNYLAASMFTLVAMVAFIALLFWYRCIDVLMVAIALLTLVVLRITLQSGSALDLPEPLAFAFFILVLCDPASTPTSRCGRLIYGVLLAVLLFLFDHKVSSLRGVVFAGFFASLCGPLIDWLVINSRRQPDTAKNSAGGAG